MWFNKSFYRCKSCGFLMPNNDDLPTRCPKCDSVLRSPKVVDGDGYCYCETEITGAELVMKEIGPRMFRFSLHR